MPPLLQSLQVWVRGAVHEKKDWVGRNKTEKKKPDRFLIRKLCPWRE